VAGRDRLGGFKWGQGCLGAGDKLCSVTRGRGGDNVEGDKDGGGGGGGLSWKKERVSAEHVVLQAFLGLSKGTNQLGGKGGEASKRLRCAHRKRPYEPRKAESRARVVKGLGLSLGKN